MRILKPNSFAFLTAALILIFSGCEDQHLKVRKIKTSFIESIEVQKDPQLIKLMGDLFNNSQNPSGRSLNTDFGEVDMKNALKLNDTIYQRTRYSLMIISKSDSSIFENLVLSVRKEGVFMYIIQYLPDPKWLRKNYNSSDLSKFTGTIRQLDIYRKLVTQVKLHNGLKVDQTNKGGRTSECCSWSVVSPNGTFGSYLDINCGGDSYLLFLRTSDCGGGDPGGTPSGSDGGSDYGPPSGSPSGSGTSGGGSGGSSGTSSYGVSGTDGYGNPIPVLTPEYKVCPGTDFVIEEWRDCSDLMTDDQLTNLWEDDKIDDSNLRPCMKTILIDIKNLSQGSVGKIIQIFSGSTPGFNWEMKDGLLQGGVNASTIQQYNTSTNTVTSIFDGNKFSNATDLSIARTVLHESIHSYLIAYFYNTPNFQQRMNDYPGLMADYINSKYDANSIQHAEFVRSFVGGLALSLEEYGLAKGYNLGKQFYQDLAWGGLTEDKNGNETLWFKNAIPSASDRNRIKDTIKIELTGYDNNGQIQSAKGTNAGC